MRQAPRKPRPSFLVEEMEPRLLFAADAAALLGLPVVMAPEQAGVVAAQTSGVATVSAAVTTQDTAASPTIAVLPAEHLRHEIAFLDAGVPVHVMTANDYLARRDATELAPLYAALGLRVAWVTSASPGLVLRGLCMAIVDEACTPLILSRPVSQREAEQRHRLALFLARQLQQGHDFTLAGAADVALTDAGQQRLAELSSSLGGPWRWQRHTREQVSLALVALHGFHRDRHYLVRDGEVHIVDGHTGRLAVGRVWSRGLHQMVAIKEGLAPQADNETLTEARAELLRTYGLPVCRAALRLPDAAQAALATWLCRRVQQQHEAEARDQRWALRVQERLLARQLALAGRQDWD